MMRTTFLIDGFNFYHSIKPLDHRYRWFDYHAYCSHFLVKNDTLQDIYYFTAKAYWRPKSVLRHEVFIDALESKGVKVVLGKFKDKPVTCPNGHNANPPGCHGCTRTFTKHEEKATDVNIALYAYHLAHIDDYDKVVIVSGDTDMVPAITMVRRVFSNKSVGVLYPLNRTSKELRKVSDFTYKTIMAHLDKFQLPETIQLPEKTLYRPKEWR